jgi:uncharacterized RDD family membrane protein YckC
MRDLRGRVSATRVGRPERAKERCAARHYAWPPGVLRRRRAGRCAGAAPPGVPAEHNSRFVSVIPRSESAVPAKPAPLPSAPTPPQAPPAASGFSPAAPTAQWLATAPAPGIWRRLACWLYEGVLLFGVVVVVGLIYGVATQQRHALQGTFGLQATLFFILGLYFVWLWSGRGQTLAMQTWHVRLVRRDGSAVSRARALVRYLLAWIWFVPALLALQIAGLRGAGASFAVIAAGVLAYAALARLHPDRQFWHDAVCGTRLVTWRPPPRKKSKA